MELGSSKHSEYKELELTLKSYGIFEDGMQLEEMRQVLLAMELSVQQHASNLHSCEESILDYTTQSENIFSSTMIVNNQAPVAEGAADQQIEGTAANIEDSPPIEPVTLTFYAQVHQALDWSPRTSRKRLRSEISPREHDSMESNSKHMYSNETPISIIGSSNSSAWNECSSSLYTDSTESIPPIGEMSSHLLISTSSPAVSDISNNFNEHPA